VILKKRSSKRKKRETRREVTYCIEILEWDLPYSYSLNINKEIIYGPIWEHMGLEIKGKLIHPEKLAEKTVDVNLLGDRRVVPVLEKPQDFREWEPKCVGTLTVRGASREYLGSLPFDMLSQLAFLIHAGKIKYLIMSGKQLQYGSAEIRSVHFSKEFKVGDWS